MPKIIPSITTIGLANSHWTDKIRELLSLKIPETGLFLTGIDSVERKICFDFLLKALKEHSFQIPFVHAVSHMTEDEYWFLVDNFGTKYFNLHPMWEYPLEHPLGPKIREKILIENNAFWKPLTTQDIEGFGGICFDLSHLEDSRLNSPDILEENIRLLKDFPVLANHISAISPIHGKTYEGMKQYSTHLLSKGNFNYLSQLPDCVFSDLRALEVEDSLKNQSEAIAALSNLEVPWKIAA